MTESPAHEARPAGHVATVQRLYAAFAQGNVEAVLAMLSPDVEWKEPDNPFNPAGGTRRGVSGVLEWLRVGKAAEDILALEPLQFLTGGDSRAFQEFFDTWAAGEAFRP